MPSGKKGEHLVKCDGCRKKYHVSTQHQFLGFETNKFCTKCSELIEENMCLCD